MHDIPRPMETFLSHNFDFLVYISQFKLFFLAITNSKYKLRNVRYTVTCNCEKSQNYENLKKVTITFLFLFCVVEKKQM